MATTTTALTLVQQKAIDLRGYLHQDNVKNTLQDALPKWLSVDRMLRIVFSSVMRTPKLLECTKESILQSVMMCAQLGLEPILGRAYLIPYHNSKNIGGKWTKVYECQMQPGYQGLIDLARRSDNIADVWGANVYENDVFSLNFGMDRDLTHNPWYMDPEKRKKGSGGEIIGAYVVWKLKDGTKHPDFMPISEIHKRRERSQAYTWAETGDPKKGGGKRDSVWHQWPEEMNLKTVIKHSAKMVPSSIEFMSAVTMDDDSELGRRQINPLSFDLPALGNDGGHLLTSESDLVEQFDNIMAANYGAGDLQALTNFIIVMGESNGDLSPTEVKAEVMRENDIDNFCNAFESYLKQQEGSTTDNPTAKPETIQPDHTGDTDPKDPGPWAQPKWNNLKGPGVKSLAENHSDMFMYQSPNLRQAFADKWGRCKELETLRFPFTDAGIWRGYLDQDNPDASKKTEEVDCEMTDNEMDLLNEFNGLWSSVPQECKDHACLRARCSVMAGTNQFVKPAIDQMPEFIKHARKWMERHISDNDNKTPFDD